MSAKILPFTRRKTNALSNFPETALMKDIQKGYDFSSEIAVSYEQNLSPLDQRRGSPTLTAIKATALISEGFSEDAYDLLTKALADNPHCLTLTVCLRKCLARIRHELIFTAANNPRSKFIPIAIRDLLREGAIKPTDKLASIQHLICNQDYAAAKNELSILVALYPSTAGILEAAEVLHQRYPTEETHTLVCQLKEIKHCEVNITAEDLSPLDFSLAEAALEIAEQSLKIPDLREVARDLINSIVGEWPESRTVNLTILPLYSLKIRLDLIEGDAPSAFLGARLLMSANPADPSTQELLELAGNALKERQRLRSNNHLWSKEEISNAEDLLRYTNISDSNYALLVRSLLSSDEMIKAKDLCKSLLSFSPRNSTFLKASLEVAVLSEDHEWAMTIRGEIANFLEETPWRTDIHTIHNLEVNHD